MKKSPPEKESFGTRTGEKARAEANEFTDEKRDQLMNRGMAIIYGATNNSNSNSNSKANTRRP